LAQKALATGEILGPIETGALSLEALRLAEASGDPQAIMRAVHARHQALSGPDHVAVRVTLAERMTALAEAERDPNAELWRRLARIDAAFELGEPAALRENVPRLEVLADRLAWPLAGRHAHRLRASIALGVADPAPARPEWRLRSGSCAHGPCSCRRAAHAGRPACRLAGAAGLPTPGTPRPVIRDR
jgi:hypothetical protein